MSYSRRKLLRDGAVSCLAGAVTSSVPFIDGCKSNPQPDAQPKPQQATLTSPAFKSGIRIFFIGAWLFTPDITTDPSDTRISALTLDLDPGMHHFPYGPYKTLSGATTNLGATGVAKPYTIKIEGVTSKATVSSLFKAAAETQTFMWIPSLKVKADADLGKIGNVDKRLRRISVPRPDQILTADFLDGSNIVDKSGFLYKPVVNPPGAPSAFIFDYWGASKLAADFDPSNTVTSGTDSDSDYHLRVVPQWSDHCPNEQHAADMFNNLLALIDMPQNSALSLDVANAKQVLRGNNVAWVTEDELDIVKLPSDCPKTIEEKKSHRTSSHQNHAASLKTASCAGGGGGIG